VSAGDAVSLGETGKGASERVILSEIGWYMAPDIRGAGRVPGANGGRMGDWERGQHGVD
jgi:hypothetical protein